jgi:hypothetical protein
MLCTSLSLEWRLAANALGRFLAGLWFGLAWQSWILCAAENQTSSASSSATPGFSVAAGIYSEPVSVKLKCSQPGGTVRYTLDGSEPTSSSPTYSDPIQIKTSTLLKAKIFGSIQNSPILSQTYIIADPELAEFNSNLPLFVLSSFGKSIPHNQRAQVSVRVIDPRNGRSSLVGPAHFDGRGNLNIRGNTSLRYPKRSYHLKTVDDTGLPQKVELLGFPSESDWILYAPYPDKTLMRDVLAYELSNSIGRYAPRTQFVEVFVNDAGGPLNPRHYMGVYVLVEKIKRDKSRVDIEKLSKDDNAEPNISGGYIFKKDHTDQIEINEGLISPSDRPTGKKLAFTSSQGNHFFYVEPDSEEITSAQKAWLRQYVNAFERILYSENFKDAKTGYAAFINPASFIDHHWLVELTKNIDGFRFSTYYYKNRGGKLNMGPIWDWNLSFGNASGREGYVPEGWYWPQLDDQQYTWFRRLFDDPDFTQKYTDRWGQLRRTQFSTVKIHARIDQIAKLLDEAQARNFQRWRILGRHVNPNSYVGRTYKDEVTWMKQWIAQRIDWIDRQFTRGPEFSRPAGTVDAGLKIDLTASSGKIYYTTDGSDPRAAGGAVSPKAQVYRAPLTINETTVVFTRVYLDRRWSYPAMAKFTVNSAASTP